MAYVIAAPEMVTSAATDLATIGSNLSAARTAAAAHTVAVVPAAADEVSAGVAHLFSQHAADYQALAGQATAFHEQFVQNLTASARSYAATEAANAALLRPLSAATGIVNKLNSLPLFQSLPQSLRDLVTTLPRPLQSLIYNFFALLSGGYSGFFINLGLIILTAPISIPLLLVLVGVGLFAI